MTTSVDPTTGYPLTYKYALSGSEIIKKETLYSLFTSSHSKCPIDINAFTVTANLPDPNDLVGNSYVKINADKNLETLFTWTTASEGTSVT